MSLRLRCRCNPLVYLTLRTITKPLTCLKPTPTHIVYFYAAKSMHPGNKIHFKIHCYQ